MGTLGYVHTVLGSPALALGAWVLLTAKGTARHRYLGYAYVASMTALNLTALMIYRVFKTFGPFT